MPSESHLLPTHELLTETDLRLGLSSDEAARRRERYGLNLLPEAQKAGFAARFFRQFKHPLIYVLLVAGTVTFLLGERIDSAAIFGVVIVNAIVGFIQETKAEAALDALRSLVKTEARVRRDGRHVSVPSEFLVPGDVVLIEAGEKVPADMRLTTAVELKLDESALTGESVTVSKDEAILPDAATAANMLYAGTFVTHGYGAGVVVATGAETELGEIHRLVGEAEQLATPLAKKLARFSQLLTVAILGLAAVTFAVGLARGEAVASIFTAAVALAVGAIPEGLPAAVTIMLAIGVGRMARRRAVIRRLPAVETLGSTTVVCSDKTGTLTKNEMTVTVIWTPEGRFPVGEKQSPALWWTLVAGAGCNDARIVDGELVGDPTDTAMLMAAKLAGLGPEAVGSRIATIPFSSERKYMATLHDDRLVLAKGAVERVLALSRYQMIGSIEVELDAGKIIAAAEELASEGLRVIATAMGHLGDDLAFEAGALDKKLVFTGLEAMIDPPRPEAIPAVATCHRAGIDVKMITGDHATTAVAVARQLGISGGAVLTGPELAELGDDEYPDAVARASVFARVSPEQKLRLVEGLQARSEVVAMTGDGVNDAPALRQADIGIAMGSGTEVAKEAADMVLTDDNFATIEAAIEEGRGIFDNLSKFIAWTLPTNLGEGSVLLLAILLGTTLPVLPVQILWINMTTAIALGLMLAFEPKEAGIMERPPRNPNQPLLTPALILRMFLVAGLLVVESSWIFEWEMRSGAPIESARSAAVNVLVAQQVFYLFSCRSMTRAVGIFSNPWILFGVAVQALAQLAFTYLPAMNRIFHTAPIGLDAWIRVGAAVTAGSVLVAIEKSLRRNRDVR